MELIKIVARKRKARKKIERNAHAMRSLKHQIALASKTDSRERSCKLVLIDIRHRDANITLRELALILLRFPILPIEDSLPVLVHLNLGDNTVAGVDANLDRHLIGLLAGDTLNVDDVFLPVAGEHLPLALVLAAHDAHLIVLAHRQRAHLVLLAQVGAERRGHDHASHRGRGGKVRLAALSPRGRDGA